MKFLEEKFKRSQVRTLSDKRRVTNAIVKRTGHTSNRTGKTIRKEGIYTVKNAQDLLYGITYVDYTTKNVFKEVAWAKNIALKLFRSVAN